MITKANSITIYSLNFAMVFYSIFHTVGVGSWQTSMLRQITIITYLFLCCFLSFAFPLSKTLFMRGRQLLKTRTWSNQPATLRQAEQTESRKVFAENVHWDPERRDSSCSVTATCVYDSEQEGGQMSHSAGLCYSPAAVDSHGADTSSL